nr:efflux transporter outer membrane subunit [uncultured Rhodoferax sp.]
MLSGCASVPVPPLPQVLPAHWQERPAANTSEPTPDLHTWWLLLGDPSLNALVNKALAQNLSLAQARSQLRQARLLAGRDANSYRPQLSTSARPSQEVSAVDSYYQISLDASWELGLFGAREAANQAGQAHFDLSEADARSAYVSVVAEVVRQYADLRSALHQQVMAQRLVEIDTQTLAKLQLQVQQQLGSNDALHDAQLRIAQAQVQHSEYAQAAKHAAQALAVLLGQATPDAAWIPVVRTEPPTPLVLPSFSLTQVPADLLRYRPEIRKMHALVLESSAELGQARADLYPRITLGASLLYAHNITRNRRTRNNDVPAVGPLVDIPLFDWGRRKALADAKQQALEAALQAYHQAVLEGVAETENALSNLQHSTQRSQHLQTLLDTLERRTGQQETLRRLGLASELDRLAAERAGVQAQLGHATAQLARTHAFIALYKSLGGAPWPADDARPPTAGAAP